MRGFRPLPRITGHGSRHTNIPTFKPSNAVRSWYRSPSLFFSVAYELHNSQLFCFHVITTVGRCHPSKGKKMNSTIVDSVSTIEIPSVASQSDSARCQHVYPNGRRCRLRVAQAGLCSRHVLQARVAKALATPAPSDFDDLSADLLPNLPTSPPPKTFACSWRAFSPKSPKAASLHAAPPFSLLFPASFFIPTAPSKEKSTPSPSKSSSIFLAPNSTDPRTADLCMDHTCHPVLPTSPHGTLPGDSHHRFAVTVALASLQEPEFCLPVPFKARHSGA